MVTYAHTQIHTRMCDSRSKQKKSVCSKKMFCFFLVSLFSLPVPESRASGWLLNANPLPCFLGSETLRSARTRYLVPRHKGREESQVGQTLLLRHTYGSFSGRDGRRNETHIDKTNKISRHTKFCQGVAPDTWTIPFLDKTFIKIPSAPSYT